MKMCLIWYGKSVQSRNITSVTYCYNRKAGKQTALARSRMMPMFPPRIAHPEEHELVERLVPLHEEDAGGHGAAEVLVAVVGVSAHAAPLAALGVGYLRVVRGVESGHARSGHKVTAKVR